MPHRNSVPRIRVGSSDSLFTGCSTLGPYVSPEMMKRALLYLCLLSIGFSPVVADPRHPRNTDPRAAREDGRSHPDFEGRRNYDPGADDRPRRRQDQDNAREAMRAGAIRPLRDIQQQWRGDMPGYDYLGSDYDADAGSYRLKFLRDGSVVWIDIDGRTGREIGRRGR